MEDKFIFIDSSPSKKSDQPSSDTSSDDSFVFLPPNTEDMRQRVDSAENALPYLGGIFGGIATYKGLGKNLLRPAPGLFSPAPETISPVGQPPSGALPSTVENVMQSQRESGPTGRQREAGHNWETERQRMVQRTMGIPETPEHPIVTSGPMYPTESGIAVPKNVAAEMESEKAAREWAAKVQAQQLMEQEAAKARLLGRAAGVAKVGSGVVGGAISAKELFDAAKGMYENGIRTPEVIKILSGVGGLMMMRPSAATTTIGAALQVPQMIEESQAQIPRSVTGLDL